MPPHDLPGAATAAGVDVVVPVHDCDSPAVRRWLAGSGRPPLRHGDGWRQRPWLALSPAAQQDLRPDLTLSPAARQLDQLLRARAGHLSMAVEPESPPTAALPLRPGERALLSRRHERALVGLLRSVGLLVGVKGSSPPPSPERAVISFSAVDWWFHNRAHSDVQISRALAADRPVLMVNSLGLRVPRPSTSTQSGRRILRKVGSLLRGPRTPIAREPRFHVMTALALPPGQSGWLRAGSARLAAWHVRATAAWYGLSTPHLLVTIPSAADLLPHVPHSCLLYNRSDLHSSFPEVDAGRVADLEDHLMQDADAVLYVSRALQLRDAPSVGSRGHYLGHGVDVAHFTRRPPEQWPHDIAILPGPRIGFFGGLDDYVVDLALLERLSDALPDCRLVLIGDATCSMTSLTSRRNVSWLGKRDYALIPAYGSAFDVAIMPWLDNEWIRYCNPVKLKEYLALGLRVVSTPYPELAEYRDVVQMATASSFPDAVRTALTAADGPSDRLARRARVAQDTWQDKAADVLDIMRTVSSMHVRRG